MVDLARVRALDPEALRSYLGDGNYGGRYQRPDAEMLALHKRFPHYGFDRHKGYSTEQHITAIRIHGISEVHRRSFAPVRESMANFGGSCEP